jgi:HEAT repeat protein
MRQFTGIFLILLLFSCLAAAQTAADDLTRQIATGTSDEKRSALFAIRSLKDEASSRLAVPALRDADETVRATAAFSVLYLPPDEAFQLLRPNLNDPSPMVRRETAYAIGQTKVPAAVPVLIDAFRVTKEADVRSALIVALGHTGNSSAIQFLSSLLQPKQKKIDEFMRRSAARSIGLIAWQEQVGKFLFSTPESFLPEKYKSAGSFRDLAAGNADFMAAINVLTTTLQNQKDSGDVRREAAFALGAIAAPQSVAVLTQFAADKDYYLAEICREALRKQTR